MGRRVGLLWAVVWTFVSAAATGATHSHDATAARLGATARRMGFDLPRYIAMLDGTADALIDRAPNLGADYPIWVIPSRAYPEMYVRDTFWTLYGYGKGPYLGQFVGIFSRNAQHAAWQPPLNGLVPRFVRKNVPNPADGRPVDESTMFWIIANKVSGKTVASEPYLERAHQYLKSLQTPQGLAIVSHGWIDAWEPVSKPVVSANNQGLYAVALRALRDMGGAVSPDEIKTADDQYRALYQGGYVRAYQGSTTVEVSALIGEALALYLWDESILGPQAVLSTVAKFQEVFYEDGKFLGYKCLSHPDGSYLDPKEFWEIAERDPGNYQNGASWLLYEGLALYAAARHSGDDRYLERFIGRLQSETRLEWSSKEFICTGGTCGGCQANPAACLCPDGKCGLGSYNKGRSGYGWNLFLKRLLLGRDEFKQQTRGT